MSFHHFCSRIFLFTLILGLTCGGAAAQSDRGTIAGTVLDGSGAAVADAKITATSSETGAVYEAMSGPTGGFRIQDVRVGTYSVTAVAQGFRSEQRTSLVVQVNSTTSLDFTLQP